MLQYQAKRRNLITRNDKAKISHPKKLDELAQEYVCILETNWLNSIKKSVTLRMLVKSSTIASVKPPNNLKATPSGVQIVGKPM